MSRTRKEELLLQALGQRVAELRRELGITPEQLAAKSQLNRSYVRKLEHGQGNPSYLVMISLAKALRVDVEELIKR